MTKNIGHNSKDINKNTSELLRRYIESVETYQDQIKDLQGSVKEIFDEAKSAGFDVKTIKKVIKLRATEKAKAQEEQYLLETYCEAVQLDLFK